MSSSENRYAARAARFYGPERVRQSREERIAWLRTRICQTALRYTPDRSERSNLIQFISSLIHQEQADEQCAQRARVYGVEYRRHIDGRCRYWQNLRWRKFEAVGHRCEQCDEPRPLEAHRRHYNTLGFEELDDIEALCRACYDLKRASRLSARLRRARLAMAHGQTLHLEHRKGVPCWSLSSGEPLRPEVAEILICDPSVSPDGGALFDNLPGQKWRMG